MTLNLIKLCVGCDTVEDLMDWHREELGAARPWRMHTRQTPKRASDLVEDGSLYRVFKGFILCRQRILAVDTVGQGATKRCEVTVDPDVVLVEPTPRRAFQGWRYLEAKDAPVDLRYSHAADVPAALARQLREIGAW